MYIKPLLFTLAASAILLVSICVYFYYPLNHQPFLIRDLVNTPDKVRDIYRLRVNVTYGDIKEQDELKKSLAFDGYNVRNRFNMAFYKDKSITGCDTVWTVVWDTDNNGGIIGVDGGVSRSCH